ncbi:hypothetical protein, partial [Roseateles sp. LKC17W]
GAPAASKEPKGSACAGQNDISSNTSAVGMTERRNRQLVQRSLKAQMPTITVSCVGLTESEGPSAAIDVQDEFAHRPWQTKVHCRWESGVLRLTATNDFDTNGQALLDEFWDTVLACSSPVNPVHFDVEVVA